eukprot:6303891-Amphidinium_carterae.1
MPRRVESACCPWHRPYAQQGPWAERQLTTCSALAVSVLWKTGATQHSWPPVSARHAAFAFLFGFVTGLAWCQPWAEAVAVAAEASASASEFHVPHPKCDCLRGGP